METALIIIGSVFIIYVLVMIPLQYRYISEFEELKKKSGQTQNEIYENMSFEKQQLNFNLQGNLMNLPSTSIAIIVYKIRQRNAE